MAQLSLLWLLVVTTLAVVTADAQFSVLTLQESILKGQTITVSMNCSMEHQRKCTWHLVPLAKKLSSDDSPKLMDRHGIRIERRICYLDIKAVGFKDRGRYYCSLDGDPPKIGWDLILLGSPGSPIISYSDGTKIEGDVIAIDETPATISLACASSGAWPKYQEAYWTVDGEHLSQTFTFTLGREDGLWSALGQASVSFSETEGREFAVKRLTCITRHATGTTNDSKMIGIRNPNQTVVLLHESKSISKRGRLQCQTYMFPWPILYQIVRFPTHPPCLETETHGGRQLDVEEEGNYVCRVAVVKGRVLITRETIFRWIESNVVQIGTEGDPECPLTTEATSEETSSISASEILLDEAADATQAGSSTYATPTNFEALWIAVIFLHFGWSRTYT